MVSPRTWAEKVQEAPEVIPAIVISAPSKSKKYGHGVTFGYERSMVGTVTSIDAFLDVVGLVC